MTAPLSLPGDLTADDLAFDKQDGLLPGVLQDAATGRVLMVGYLDREALQATLDTGLATFYSRSRGQQWTKGETSGNTLAVQRLEVDCDRDTLLLHCLPAGPTCHTGAESCFDDAPSSDVSQGPASATAPAAGGFLTQLEELVADRHTQLPEGSYTTRLFTGGVRGIAQKVGEEGVETALAAVAQDDADLAGEAADLLYHLLVLLRSRGLSLSHVEQVLRERHSG